MTQSKEEFIQHHAGLYVALMYEFGQAFDDSVEEEVLTKIEADDDYPEIMAEFVTGMVAEASKKLVVLMDKHVNKLALEHALEMWSTKE